MAIVALVGPVTGDLLECVSSGGLVSVVADAGRGSGFAFRSHPVGVDIGWVRVVGMDAQGFHAGYSVASAFHRFLFWYQTRPAAQSEPVFNSETGGGIAKAEVRLNRAGVLEFYDRLGVLVATGSKVLAQGARYVIDVLVGTGAAAVWAVRVDEAVELSSAVSGTADLGVGNNGRSNYGKSSNRHSQSVDFFVRDIVISDAGFVGRGQCDGMALVGDGFYTSWGVGAGSGSRFEQVDEIPRDGDVSYLLSPLGAGNAYSAAVESALEAGILVGGVVNAVKVVAAVKRDGANGKVRGGLRSGGVDSDTTADFTTGSGYEPLMRVFENDPATGVAWVRSALDSLEPRIVERSAVNKSRVTMLAVAVDWVPLLVPGGGVSVRNHHKGWGRYRAVGGEAGGPDRRIHRLCQGKYRCGSGH